MSLNTLTEVNVNEVIEYFIEIGLEEGQFVVPMLWGQPGIGKSDAIRLYCRLLEKKTRKKVILHDVRLSLYSAVDLKGLPVPNEKRTETVWLIPELFKMDESEEVINVLFLDEFSSAVPQVQVASYQLILDRQIGPHKLPNNCITIGAGNRMDDRGVTHKMPSPLANRIQHFNVVFDLVSWRKWAFENNISDYVIAFLSARPDRANTFEEFKGTALAFATPRSWSMVSKLIERENFENFSEKMQVATTEGLIGSVTSEFFEYREIVKVAPTFEKIAKGDTKDFNLKEIENRQDVEYFLFAMIVANLSKINAKETKSINNVIDFVSDKFSSNEMVTLAYSSIVENAKQLKNVLLNNKSFTNWVKNNQDLLKKLKKVA